MNRVPAPWTAQQINNLRRWQEMPDCHPFTCPNPHVDRVLIPTIYGWICPDTHCDYTQDWALDFMTEGRFA